jgi:hypothetical protein
MNCPGDVDAATPPLSRRRGSTSAGGMALTPLATFAMGAGDVVLFPGIG